MSLCLNCQEPIIGRIDKKFCSVYCKSTYHYKKNKDQPTSLYMQIDKHLKKNRQILKNYNKSGKSVVRKSELIGNGFSPKFFTHYWKAKNGNLYLFCYEYGFMEIKEKRANKYVLIKWQKYMDI